MKNLYLFQAQDPTLFRGKLQYWFPYSIGLLWAYARQFPSVASQWICHDIFFRRRPVHEVIETMVEPDLCGFSVYAWNRKYTEAMAEAIKKRWPRSVLVFGGPEVGSSWLKYDWADCLVLGEGERSWVKILDAVAQDQPIEKIVKTPRMDSLDDVPSPYTTGVFDPLIAANPDMAWTAPLETNRGCPYSCTFCDWGGLTQSKIKKFQLHRIEAEINWLSRQNVKNIYITDANFGIFRERDLEIARMIGKWVRRGSSLEYIQMNYAKMSNETVFEIAKEMGHVNKGITFSVQSMNPDTLKAIKRQNMKSNDIGHLVTLADKYGLHYYSEMILGLPEETQDTWKSGLCELLELGQHSLIEIMLAQVLENTELHRTQVDQYRMETIEVSNFLPLGVDEIDIKETSHLVKSTSTMTTDDLIQGYLYGWMISHLHMNNYSKLLAKFHRHVNGISYRQFYDRMWERLLQGGDTVVDQEFQMIKQALTNIYHHGETCLPHVTLGGLQFVSTARIYQAIYECYDMVEQIARSFGPIPTSMIEIHRRTLVNDRYSLPFRVQTEFDIDSWQPGRFQYEITSKNVAVPKDKWAFQSNAKRDKHLHTIIRQVDNVCQTTHLESKTVDLV